MLSAAILSSAGGYAASVAAVELLAAAGAGLAAFLCFRQIPVAEEAASAHAVSPAKLRFAVLKNVRESLEIVARDGRYRRHLLGCLLEAFFGFLSLSLIAALLGKSLGFGYLAAAALLHGIPTLAAFAATGVLGGWFDRADPWVSWARVRFAFAIDAMALSATPWVAGLCGTPVMLVLLVTGRLFRGAVQGGWWILWWQIGITYFAPPGEDTSRYAAIMVFLYGLVRLVASLTGMGLALLAVEPATLLWIGALGILASALYSLRQAARERREHCPATFAAFEAQFDPEHD
jgi:hypothetical protein